MGRKEDHAIEKLRNNPKNVRFQDAESILLRIGCTKRMHGSHAIFTYDDRLPITIPYQKPFILPVYVKKILQFIDKIKEIQADDAN